MKSTKLQTLSAGHAIVNTERSGSEDTRHYLQLMTNTDHFTLQIELIRLLNSIVTFLFALRESGYYQKEEKNGSRFELSILQTFTD